MKRDTVKRCFDFLVAIDEEMNDLREAPEDERARTLAMMKVKLMGYAMTIWTDRELFESDIIELEKFLMSPVI